MAAIGTRNARVLVNGTAVNKTHGANIQPVTDYSEDTAHGDAYKSYVPGLKDFTVAIEAWYDDAYHVLQNAAIANTALTNVLVYPDYARTTHYWRCPYMYVSMDSFDLAIGNTAAQSFTLRNAGGGTPQWVYT